MATIRAFNGSGTVVAAFLRLGTARSRGSFAVRTRILNSRWKHQLPGFRCTFDDLCREKTVSVERKVRAGFERGYFCKL